MSEELFVNSIKMDERCQPRHRVDPDVVAEYSEAMRNGASFPPVTVFSDGGTKWLADGFHRVQAARQAGAMTIAANIIEGTIRDAILHAVGANADHGLRRTNADKRRAVETLLVDSEWSGWSDREIARRCSVDHKTVAALRTSVTGEIPSERNFTDRYGNTRTMNTANIGTKPAARQNLATVDLDSGDIVEDDIVPSEVIDYVPAPPISRNYSTPMAPPVAPPVQSSLGAGERVATEAAERHAEAAIAERVSMVTGPISQARAQLVQLRKYVRYKEVIASNTELQDEMRDCIREMGTLSADLRAILGDVSTPTLRRVS